MPLCIGMYEHIHAICICMWMCAGVKEYLCVSMHMCIHAHEGQRTISSVFIIILVSSSIYINFAYFFETESPWTKSLLILLGWLASEVQGSTQFFYSDSSFLGLQISNVIPCPALSVCVFVCAHLCVFTIIFILGGQRWIPSTLHNRSLEYSLKKRFLTEHGGVLMTGKL